MVKLSTYLLERKSVSLWLGFLKNVPGRDEPANAPTWDRGAEEKASENGFGTNIPQYNTQKLGENQLDARRRVDETWQEFQAAVEVHLADPTPQTRLIRQLKYLKWRHVYLGAS